MSAIMKPSGEWVHLRLNKGQMARAEHVAREHGALNEMGKPSWKAGLRFILSGAFDLSLNDKGLRLLKGEGVEGGGGKPPPRVALGGCPAEREPAVNDEMLIERI